LLTANEVIVSLSLILFSYFSKGYATCMSSQARYVAPVLPVYIIMGYFLDRLPRSVTITILGIFAIWLGFYSALFVRWYELY
jgi:hypothetical protein